MGQQSLPKASMRSSLLGHTQGLGGVSMNLNAEKIEASIGACPGRGHGVHVWVPEPFPATCY